jgi:hypothetical protein
MKGRVVRLTAKLLIAAGILVVVPAAALTMTATPAVAGTNCGEPPFNSIVPEGFFADTFSNACSQHDICYWGGKEGHPGLGNRAQCDTTFLNNMSKACGANYGWWDPRLGWCNQEASSFYVAVRTVGGHYWAGNPSDNV